MTDEITQETVTNRISQTSTWLDRTGEYDDTNPYHTTAKAEYESLVAAYDGGNGWDSKKGASNILLEMKVNQLTNLLSEIPKTQRADGSGLCSRVMGKVSTAPISVQTSTNELKKASYAAYAEMVRANQYLLAYEHDGKDRLIDLSDRDKAIHLYAQKMSKSAAGKNNRSWTQYARGDVTGLLVTSSKADGSDIELTVIDGVSVMTATYTAPEKAGRSD